MSVNLDRPIITYETSAFFQSSSPSYDLASNSGENLSFVPFVQGVDFSFDIPMDSVASIGTKSFVNRSNTISPNIDFSIKTLENFGHLFSNLFVSGAIKDDLDDDTNFYAVIGDKKGFDVSNRSLSGVDVLGFGNCFLKNVQISQSINGLMTSDYSFTASNIQAQKLEQNGNFFSGDCPAINLTGDQKQETKVLFDEIDNYYTEEGESIIPSYSTNVLISGSDSVGSFLVKTETVQNFNLNLEIQRKPIYSIGKTYPLIRKSVFPSENSFTFSSKISDFEVNEERSNLKNFLNLNDTYTLNISGQNKSGEVFDYIIKNAKLTSKNNTISIGGDFETTLNFKFEINEFKRKNLFLKLTNGGFLLQQNFSKLIAKQNV